LKVIAKVILVPKFAADGSVNKIASGDLTKTILQAHFDNANQLDRFYPTPLLKNVTNERADPEYFEWEGGGKEFVREGVRQFTGVISKGTPELEGRLNLWNGQEMGFYAIDKDGNFIYKDAGDGSGDYLPIPIDGGSLYTGFKWATNSDPSMLAIQFDVLQTEKDSDLRYTLASALDFDGLDSGDVYGLSEVTVNITAAAATTGTFTATLDMGTPQSGLTKTDIAMNNDTSDTVLTVDNLVESTVNLGTYTWTITAGLATGDTVRVTIAKTKLSHSYGTKVVA
jgi:hypothetical protein